MSRDIFVQDLPERARTVAEIPDGWLPRPLPIVLADVVHAVLEIAPDADVRDPTWMHVIMTGFQIEVSCRDGAPLRSFALHVRASDHDAADAFVRALLARLGARALDTGADGGIFE